MIQYLLAALGGYLVWDAKKSYKTKYAKGGEVVATSKEITSFVDYVNSFYGKEGLYAFEFPNKGFTKQQIRKAVKSYLNDLESSKNKTWEWGGGDSIDRERVREYLIGHKYAKGGLVVTSINDIPDLMKEVEAGKVTYRGLGVGKLFNQFFDLAGESGTIINVKGVEYFITDSDFKKLDWDEVGKKWKGLIKFSAPKRKMAKGGVAGDVDYLTDKLLSQKIQIFLDKVKPIFYYYIDDTRNTLIVGFDENYTTDAADKFQKEASSSKEFFDADSIGMKFMPETKATEFSIKLKRPVIFS